MPHTRRLRPENAATRFNDALTRAIEEVGIVSGSAHCCDPDLYIPAFDVVDLLQEKVESPAQWDLTPDQFEIHNSKWEKSVHKLTKKIVQELGVKDDCDRVTARLETLQILGRGTHHFRRCL